MTTSTLPVYPELLYSRPRQPRSLRPLWPSPAGERARSRWPALRELSASQGNDLFDLWSRRASRDRQGHRRAVVSGLSETLGPLRRMWRGPSRSGPQSKHALCATCTRSDASFWKACPSCGEATLLTTEPCVRCELGRRLRQLLGPTCTIGSDLSALYDSLAAAERPDQAVGWLKTERGDGRAGRPGSRRLGLTHETLDGLERTKSLEHLRSVLMATGHCPPAKSGSPAGSLVEATVAARADPEEQYILRRYALWHLLRRLRRRVRDAETTYGQAITVKRHLQATIALIDWLAGLGVDVASADQGHLDAWLVSAGVTRPADIGHFIRWPDPKSSPSCNWRPPAGRALRVIDPDKRWDQASWLLRDDTLNTADRVAGLLVLLYAHGLRHQQARPRARETLSRRPASVPRCSTPPAPHPLGDLAGLPRRQPPRPRQPRQRHEPRRGFPGGQPGRPIQRRPPHRAPTRPGDPCRSGPRGGPDPAAPQRSSCQRRSFCPECEQADQKSP